MNERELQQRRQQRRAIDRAYFELRLPPARIAERLGVPKKVVKKHIRRVKAKS